MINNVIRDEIEEMCSNPYGKVGEAMDHTSERIDNHILSPSAETERELEHAVQKLSILLVRFIPPLFREALKTLTRAEEHLQENDMGPDRTEWVATRRSR